MSVLPCPIFEGSEKRIEVDFSLGAASPADGLRSLTRAQLDDLMTQAACCIVSTRRNQHFDAYVLSESSLFVYPTKLVLKTCGTTQLLNAVPLLLQLATDLDCTACRCKYSRASFLFPDLQPEVYHSFASEQAYLEQHFGHLGSGGHAYVLGDPDHGLQWHVYVADANTCASSPSTDDAEIDSVSAAQRQTVAVASKTVQPLPIAANGTQPAAVKGITAAVAPATFSLEVCLTELDSSRARQFFRDDSFVSAEHTTTASGIRALVPKAVIDDYVFEPCGYSMNSQEGAGFSTIHITPETGFSYASFELSGYEPGSVDLNRLVAQTAAIFGPGKMTVALTADKQQPGCSWGQGLVVPDSYACKSISSQRFACGGHTVFYTLAAAPSALATAEPAAVAIANPFATADTIAAANGKLTEQARAYVSSDAAVTPYTVSAAANSDALEHAYTEAVYIDNSPDGSYLAANSKRMSEDGSSDDADQPSLQAYSDSASDSERDDGNSSLQGSISDLRSVDVSDDSS